MGVRGDEQEGKKLQTARAEEKRQEWWIFGCGPGRTDGGDKIPAHAFYNASVEGSVEGLSEKGHESQPS